MNRGKSVKHVGKMFSRQRTGLNAKYSGKGRSKTICDEGCVGCAYYYGHMDWCMADEEGVPDYLPKNCEEEIGKDLEGYYSDEDKI